MTAAGTHAIDPLIVDAYEGDGRKDWDVLAAAGAPWSGVILKATQGTYYNGGYWFAGNWPAVARAGANHGRELWQRWAYHYLDIRQDGAEQAQFFVRTVHAAGGLMSTDMVMVDVERAGQRAGISVGQVIDCVQTFVAEIGRLTGHAVVLYGGSWLADMYISVRMGCRYLAIARYTAMLPEFAYRRIGWDRESLALWQYCGDGESHLANYPNAAPGCGKIDISALVLPGGLAALQPLL